MIANYIIFFFWLVFEIYWRVSATKAKKDLRKRSGIYLFFRVRYLYYALNIFYLPVVQDFLQMELGALNSYNLSMDIVGVALCLIGVVFAFYARWYLGKNWSGFPSIKEDHALITTGPYRFVRHPIYTGILLMIFGSFLVEGLLWLFVFFIFLATYLHRLRIEESLLEKQFPNEYSEYKRATKSLIPFLL